MTNIEAVKSLKKIHDEVCKDIDCSACPFEYLTGGCNCICESMEKDFKLCLEHAKYLDEKNNMKE